jgi:hypothetical protein
MVRPSAPLLTIGLLVWAATAPAQSELAGALLQGGSPPISSGATTDPPAPLFAVATLDAEVGTYYLGGTRVAFLGNPGRSGVSLGASVFLAPLTNMEVSCASPCRTNPLLWRWMAELRLGTPYRADVRGLGWFSLGAGVSYLAEPGVDVGPVVSLGGGGDLRLGQSLWLEMVLKGTWAQVVAPDSTFLGPYVTFGLELGTRIDLAR